jgi:hypothetical protein
MSRYAWHYVVFGWRFRLLTASAGRTVATYIYSPDRMVGPITAKTLMVAALSKPGTK